MPRDSGFEEAYTMGTERIRELWRLKERFDKYSTLMSYFTLKESLILHRVMQVHVVDPSKLEDGDLEVLLAAEKRIFGDNGHGDGEDNA